MKSVLLIDGNSYLYRAAYAYGTEGNGTVTGVLKYISDLLEGGNFYDVVICWDKGKSRWRKELYPEYKAGREEKRSQLDMDAVHEQGDLIRSYLKYKGLKQLAIWGIEADDLLAWTTDYYLGVLGYDEVMISTSDKDLWQLLDDGVVIHNHTKAQMVDGDMVLSEMGVRHTDIPSLKALAGDSSDNIKGIPGIGEKTAIELLRTYGSLGLVLDPDDPKELQSKKRTKRILDEASLAELAYRLVKIPRLSEAKWYLTERELQDLHDLDFEVPKSWRFEFQMLADRIGIGLQMSRRLAQTGEKDFTGMVALLEKEEEGQHLSLSSIDNAVLACSKCSLRGDCGDFGPTLPSGYEDAEIMVIGRNPGSDELVGGEPFIGRAGKRLDKFLEEVGLTRRDCWITNVNKCYSENNRPPTVGEIHACSAYLKAEIEILKPKFIITFGNEAMSMVTPYGFSGVIKHCGEILEKPSGILGDIDSWVAICVHPSAALRSKVGETHMSYATKMVRGFLEARRR
jgi:uracil-DNA glycosylase family 4